MIVLDKQQIEELIDLNGMMDQIEEAYHIFKTGDFYMPPRPGVENEGKEMLYMPCYTKEVIGTKILSIFPENAKLGLPSIDGIMYLNDYRTGKPLAVMDGQTITAWRTGAVGGVGIRHLSRKDCRTVGIVGAGVQGFHLALYACAARQIHTVYVYNHSSRDLSDYLARLEKAIDNPGTKVVQCKTVEELTENSEIICTATPAEAPVLPDDKELLKGKCIIAVGSYTPGMREIPDAVWEVTDRVYIELPYACKESGDLSQPIAAGRLTEGQTVLMSDYLAEGPRKVTDVLETTYFKSVGMGLFDVCIAQKILEMAKERNIMKVVATDKAPKALGPYSQGYVHNGIFYSAGQIPINPAVDAVEAETIEEQTEQVCKNIAAVLEAAGTSFDKVIKTTCFLADMGDFAAFNEVYAKYFTSKPARSCVAVKTLPKNVKCEVELIAAVEE